MAAQQGAQRVLLAGGRRLLRFIVEVRSVFEVVQFLLVLACAAVAHSPCGKPRRFLPLSFVALVLFGWLAPGLTETLYTPDYLAESGIKYIADWVVDDEPCEIKTAHGKVLTMPYSLELNDIAMMMVQHHAAAEFESRCMDQFERLYEESKTRAKIMAIAVHPYISGVPHRIKYFERVFQKLRKQKGVVFWTGEQIHDWYRRVMKAPVKASTKRRRNQ